MSRRTTDRKQGKVRIGELSGREAAFVGVFWCREDLAQSANARETMVCEEGVPEQQDEEGRSVQSVISVRGNEMGRLELGDTKMEKRPVSDTRVCIWR
jgi:hypothetical protein